MTAAHHHSGSGASTLAQLRPAALAYRDAFVALAARDLHVLRKTLRSSCPARSCSRCC